MGDLLAALAPPSPPRVPAGPIERSADLSPCGTYRWTLRRRWAPGPEIGWAMLNPSTADHLQDDPTLRRVIGFTHRWGYGALVVVNLFPFRSASPAELAAWWADPDVDAGSAYQQNAERVRRALAGCAFAVAAWGCNEMAAARWIGWTASVGRRAALDWRCLGRTADGHPTHPLARGRHRVPDDAQAVRFDPWSMTHG